MPGRLDRGTLELHRSGPQENVAKKAAAVYRPLADKFAAGADGDLVFGIDDTGRAFIQEDVRGGQKRKLLLYLVWQEVWSSALARKKWLRGKLCYQKDVVPGAPPALFARQYIFQDGQISLASVDDEEGVSALLPTEDLQEMYDMPG